MAGCRPRGSENVLGRNKARGEAAVEGTAAVLVVAALETAEKEEELAVLVALVYSCEAGQCIE